MNRATFLHLWDECDRITTGGVPDTFHMRQTATAMQAAGFASTMVFAALIHDLFKPVAMIHHGQVAALAFDRLGSDAVVYLTGHSEWVAAVRSGSGILLRYRHRRLGQMDADSFDPVGPCEPLEHFAPLLDHYLLG